MSEIQYIVKENLSPFVNCVMTGASDDVNGTMNMPLYADGYPGIMFQQTDNGFYLLPKKKELSELFLYGQTLQPVSLDVQGPYKFIVVQLYPFASKYLLGVDPKELNDECYDLLQINSLDIVKYHHQLKSTDDIDRWIDILTDIIAELIRVNQVPQNDRTQSAIQKIINAGGLLKIKDLHKEVLLTERTLERNFKAEVGLSPKQFARIIQFQTSLHRLNDSNFEKLTDIGLDSGFTDQSHFIRTFKGYTGLTPSNYLKNLQMTG